MTMERLVDFHSHVLPGVDDGSQSVEQSLQMLRMEAQQGVHTVVATPHFYPKYDTPERFLERRDRAEERLRRAMAGQQDLPRLLVGAEVYFFRGMSDSEFLPQLTIREKGCIMVEMPMPPWSDDMYRELESIHRKWHLTPIVAHVDRYIAPFRTQGIPERLEAMPVLVQANGEFFTDRHTAALAMRMLRKGQIHLLGSDCHNLKDRKPDLGTAAQRIGEKLGPGALAWVRRFERKVIGAADADPQRHG